jgi:hypothetical protein
MEVFKTLKAKKLTGQKYLGDKRVSVKKLLQ